MGNGILQAEIIKVNGTDYMHFTNIDLKLDISDYNVRLENLFHGDPVLSESSI